MAGKVPDPGQPSNPDRSNLEGEGLTQEQRKQMEEAARKMRDALDPSKPAPKSGLEGAIGRDKYTPAKEGAIPEAVEVNPDFTLGSKKQKLSKADKSEAASRRFVLDRKYLEDHVRANGNMSVARRSSVVAYALRNLGYTPEQARIIALDAPLNASTYNDAAIRAALEYGESISRTPSGKAGDMIRSSLYPDVIEMPDAARRALATARQQATPMRRRTGEKFSSGLLSVTRFATSVARPFSDRIANLPVPGGIGGLLAINLIFLAAIIPAHPQGYTRLELVWLTLMNRTKLPEPISTKEAPAGPLVQAAMNVAQGIQEGAIAIGSLGNSAKDISAMVAGAGNNPVNRAILGGLVGGVLMPSAGQSYVPPSNTGSKPPAAPLPPSQPITTL